LVSLPDVQSYPGTATLVEVKKTQNRCEELILDTRNRNKKDTFQ